MSHRVHAKTGDVFQIPLDSDRVAYGIVVDGQSPNPIFVAVFGEAHPSDSDVPLSEIEGAEPALVALTLDAKIWHGHWPVVGSAAVDRSRFPFPCFKQAVGSVENIQVFSYDGQRHREASREEIVALDYRRTYAPIVVEKAVRALHGIQPWEERFQRLRTEDVRSRTVHV